MSELVHVRISGEASASHDQWADALNGWAHLADVIDLSEVGGHASTVLWWARLNNYFACYSDKYGERENAVLVRARFASVLLEKHRRVTRLRLRTARKAPLNVIKVLIRVHADGARIWDTAGHAPAHGERKGGIVGGYVGRVIRSFYLGWSRLAYERGADGTIISPDWNLDVRKRWVRVYLRSMFPGTRPGWDLKNLPSWGTIGRSRLIDGPRSNLPIVEHSQILRDMPGFKHRAVRTVYRTKVK